MSKKEMLELIMELISLRKSYERQITDLQKRNTELVEENRRLRESTECRIENRKV